MYTVTLVWYSKLMDNDPRTLAEFVAAHPVLGNNGEYEPLLLIVTINDVNEMTDDERVAADVAATLRAAGILGADDTVEVVL